MDEILCDSDARTPSIVETGRALDCYDPRQIARWQAVEAAARRWCVAVTPTRGLPGWRNAGPADELYRLVMQEPS